MTRGRQVSRTSRRTSPSSRRPSAAADTGRSAEPATGLLIRSWPSNRRVPVNLLARLGDQVRPIEERIGNRVKGVLRAADRHHVTAVAIQPSMLDRTPEELADVVVARSERPVPRFWAPRQFRPFISHVTSFRQRATALRQELSRFHISGFVAHETIEPGEPWQREIEAALRSMDTMAALITPDFHDRKWTDQEVGWALGSGVYVLPVRRGADPYGFLGEVQGIGAGTDHPGAVPAKDRGRRALQ